MINPAKAYTTAEYVEILRRRIWYIVIPFVLIVSGASAYTFFAPRLYRASTLVLVSPQRIPEAFVQATVTSKVEERLQSIAQEVLSRTRLEQIIGDLNLYREERKSLSREEVVALMQKDIKVELPTRKEDTKGFFTISYIGHDPNIVTTVANRLASQFIEENLKLREQQAVGTTEFLAIELTAAKAKLDQLETAVTQYKRRFMGELPEQREANIKILEQLQNQYQRVGEALRAAQDRKLFIQKQMTDMEMPIEAQGTAGYETEVHPSSGKASYLSQRTSGYKKEVPPSSGKLSNMQKQKVPQFPIAETGVSYESQKESLTRSLEDLRARYTENHPDVILTKKRLADLETKKAEQDAKAAKEAAEAEAAAKEAPETKDAVTAAFDFKKDPRYRELNNQLELTDMEIVRFREGERTILAQIEKYRARIEQTPAREQDMASLLREHQSTKETYERLLKKSQDAQQAENLEKRQKGEQFRIIDPARTPEKPFSPEVQKILLIGLLAGIGGGFGLAFFREQLDRSFHDSGDVEVTLALKVLATIPKIEEKIGLIMYRKFYGFKERPFEITPDPKFVYLSEIHQEALARLQYAVQEGKGFSVITGEAGTGKTTLAHMLLSKLNGSVRTSFIFNPILDRADFLNYVCDDLGIKSEGMKSRGQSLAALHNFLLDCFARDEKVFLIIDEAQSLEPGLLHEVRLLTNLETSKSKLLHVILLGQPELNQILAEPRFRPLKQRITVRYHLRTLRFKETKQYIQYRLKRAGSRNLSIFDNGAIREIYRYSKGIPRLINIVCDNALLTGFSLEETRIEKKVIREIITDLEGGKKGGRKSLLPLLLVILILMTVLFFHESILVFWR